MRDTRKPHIYLRNGVWWCEVYRRGPRSSYTFKLTQAGGSVTDVWSRFLVWPGL